MRTYRLNEIFYSLQGEGARTGTANIFIRFAGCNQKCVFATNGFDCDTDFRPRFEMNADEIIAHINREFPMCKAVVLTGGEPALQVDRELVQKLHVHRYFVAMETNGTVDVSELGLDWITVSPKTPEEQLKQFKADEVKYVIKYGANYPNTTVQANHYLLSPAFKEHRISRKTLNWVIGMCKMNTKWTLSVQAHKLWKIR
jgi:organic radical activating enzyme